MHDRYSAYWRTLREFIDLVLVHEPGSVERRKPYDFGFLHVAVYSCVRDNFSARLYKDLRNHIQKYILKFKLEVDLASCFPSPVFIAQRYLGRKQTAQIRDRNIFKALHKILPQFLQNLKLVVAWCYHLDRKYVKALNTDLKTEFLKMFCSEICDPVVDRMVATAQANYHDISSDMKHSLLKHLYELNPKYESRVQVFCSNIIQDQHDTNHA